MLYPFRAPRVATSRAPHDLRIRSEIVELNKCVASARVLAVDVCVRRNDCVGMDGVGFGYGPAAIVSVAIYRSKCSSCAGPIPRLVGGALGMRPSVPTGGGGRRR